MHVTPALMEQAYELLRRTPPFSRWRLPEADDVEFGVLSTKAWYGDYELKHDDGGPVDCIRLSSSKNKTLDAVLMTIAHEMCHQRLQRTGCRDRDDHGKTFDRLAKQVCRHHGWKLEEF